MLIEGWINLISPLFCFHGWTALIGLRLLIFLGFAISLRHTTLGRIPLDQLVPKLHRNVLLIMLCVNSDSAQCQFSEVLPQWILSNWA
jgi:hypothetical protein